MFAAWMTKLFGNANPEELMRQRMQVWLDWLQVFPGDGSGVGRDPAYDDGFFAIKEEVAKLAGTDDALIARYCEQLLKEVGKDLRLAAYYTFARLRLDGTVGFADGLELTAVLVAQFGEAIWPNRASARKGALEWLASPRLLDLLPHAQAFAAVDLERAVAALQLLLTHIVSWNADAQPDLSALLGRFEDDEAATAAPCDEVLAQSSNLKNVNSGLALLPIASGRDLLDQARAMAQFLAKQERGYLSSTRLIRCVRWDTVHDLPPADLQARTRLSAPRAELRQHCQRLLLQQQWHELLERVEAAFVEGANHLWFDLQYFQHMALAQAGPAYQGWADLLRSDLALMLERLSGVEHLAFSDATPFADEVTLEWLARHAVVRDLEAGEPLVPMALSGDGVNSDASQWQEMQTQASALLGSDGLEAAFAWLQGLPGLRNERQQFLQYRLMAWLAEQAGKPDTALHLLTQLNQQMGSLNLTRWEPALVFDVKCHLLRVLKLHASRKDADKPTLMRNISALQAELTVLNPAQALALN